VPAVAEPSNTGGRRNDHPVLQPPLIQVSDQLERRIRRPADALRCVVACIVIVAAIVTAIAASATTAGAETDIVGASRRLPDALSNDIPQIARENRGDIGSGPILLSALAVAADRFGDHGSGERMLTLRSFSTPASPVTAISFVFRTARNFVMARSKTARLVCPMSREG